MLRGLRQLGYVVGSVEVAAARFSALTGAGPFFVMRDVRFEQWYAGGVSQSMMLDIAFGQDGEVMIELIRPHGSWPSIYGDRPLLADQIKPHHQGYLVDDLMASASALNLGTPIVAASLNVDTQLHYYDLRPQLGMMIELIGSTVATNAFFALSREHAAGWDGTNPVRTLS